MCQLKKKKEKDTAFSSSLWSKHCSPTPFKTEVTQGGRQEKRRWECFGPQKRITVLFEDYTATHAPGVPTCWPMRGSPPSTLSWMGVISCSAVITMVFSSTSSQVGLEKADRGRVILCISRSYTRCSCCFFKSRPLKTQTDNRDSICGYKSGISIRQMCCVMTIHSPFNSILVSTNP